MKPFNRRDFLRYGAPAAGTAALAAVYDLQSRPPARPLPRIGESEAGESDPAWRILNRAGFGPCPGDLERVRAMGVDAYVEEQLDPDSIAESPTLLRRLDNLPGLTLDPPEARDYERAEQLDAAVSPFLRAALQLPNPTLGRGPGAVTKELRQACLLRAVYSARQLQEVMVEFWTDHFNIDQGKADCGWLKAADDRAIRRHALGKFRDLLAASAHSPAMLVYLDNTLNTLNPSGGPGNENYARELLELHTLGVDGGYSLRDVQEVARCFTGWGVKAGPDTWPGEFVFREAQHDPGPKVVLGRAIAGGLGRRDGEEVVDLVARHPATARNLARKLCRRFVADAEPQDLVAELAGVFERTDGDVRQVLAALFRSPHFRERPGRKLKRPFHLVAATLRALAAETDGLGPLAHLEAMGQPPFGHPLPDGFPDHVEAWVSGMLGRWTFAIDLMSGRMPGTRVDVGALVGATKELEPVAVCRALWRALTGRSPAKARMDAMIALGADLPAAGARWLALAVAGPDFQWR